MKKIIFHIDVNSAFLSWQATYDKTLNNSAIDLRKIPSAIGGNEESRHGIVLAKSDLAKKCGVKTGQTLFSARKLCPELVTVPPNFKIYRKYSNMLFDLLSDYSDEIERYSIDECFLDYTGSRRLFGEPIETAYKIKDRIQNELGFTVNIGISNNKFLAKMAGELEKPNKVITLFPEEMEKKLFPLPISEMFMVGNQTRKKLNKLGINTIKDLNSCSLDFLTKHFKDAQGEQLYNYSHGIDANILETKRDTKSVGNSVTLPTDVNDIGEIKKTILSLSDSVGTRLRMKNLKGKVVSITIKNAYFHTYSHQITLRNSTNSTNTIYEKAMGLFNDSWKNDPIRLLGLSVGKLGNDSAMQLSLFEENNENEKMAKVERVMDNLRSSFGQDIIKRGINNKDIYEKLYDKKDFYK